MNYPLGFDLSQFSQYSPIKKEQWARIKKLWEIYRDTVGLEGELYLKLAGEGKSKGEIIEAINTHRKEVEGDIQAWHELRGEIQR